MYLLDTNVLSQLVRKRPDPGLIAALSRHSADSLFTSCICAMELRQGAALSLHPGPLWERIEREILQRVSILDVRGEDALIAGDITAHLRSAGKPIDVEDVLIGATALARGLVVVTDNLRHFQRISGLKIENWLSRRSE